MYHKNKFSTINYLFFVIDKIFLSGYWYNQFCLVFFITFIILFFLSLAGIRTFLEDVS